MYTGSPIAPTIRQSFSPRDGTIDPLPLIKQRTGLDGRDKEIFIDYKSPMSLRIEWLPDGRWTGQDEEYDSQGPIADYKFQDPMPMQVCVCGCDKGACIPQRGYERPRTDTVSQHGLTLFSAPYEEWTGQIRTLTLRKVQGQNAQGRKDQHHITGAKLATEVAKRMKVFLEEMR